MRLVDLYSRHNMKYTHWRVGGNVVKEDENYVVTDNTELNNLVVSSTRLNRRKSTRGHKHKGQEEVYMFIEGVGKMELDDETIKVEPGNTVLIKDGVFHRVHAGMHDDLYFICVFEGGRKH